MAPQLAKYTQKKLFILRNKQQIESAIKKQFQCPAKLQSTDNTLCIVPFPTHTPFVTSHSKIASVHPSRTYGSLHRLFSKSPAHLTSYQFQTFCRHFLKYALHDDQIWDTFITHSLDFVHRPTLDSSTLLVILTILSLYPKDQTYRLLELRNAAIERISDVQKNTRVDMIVDILMMAYHTLTHPLSRNPNTAYDVPRRLDDNTNIFQIFQTNVMTISSRLPQVLIDWLSSHTFDLSGNANGILYPGLYKLFHTKNIILISYPISQLFNQYHIDDNEYRLSKTIGTLCHILVLLKLENKGLLEFLANIICSNLTLSHPNIDSSSSSLFFTTNDYVRIIRCFSVSSFIEEAPIKKAINYLLFTCILTQQRKNLTGTHCIELLLISVHHLFHFPYITNYAKDIILHVAKHNLELTHSEWVDALWIIIKLDLYAICDSFIFLAIERLSGNPLAFDSAYSMRALIALAKLSTQINFQHIGISQHNLNDMISVLLGKSAMDLRHRRHSELQGLAAAYKHFNIQHSAFKISLDYALEHCRLSFQDIESPLLLNKTAESYMNDKGLH